jgi:fructose-1,6-bisphosphatase/inositol monophosphatase family enzyme
VKGRVVECWLLPLLQVVTEADLNAEKAMRALIEERYPAHGILGEEFGSTRLESDWVWVLDPVDGTRDFATGTLTCANHALTVQYSPAASSHRLVGPNVCSSVLSAADVIVSSVYVLRAISPAYMCRWGTLIGLCFRSTPVLGVIDQPIAGDRWLGAHGHPTVYNGEPVVFTHDGDVPSTLAASRCVVSGAGFGALRDAGYIAAATALVAAVTTTSFTVNAYAYGLLALGAIELAFEAPGACRYSAVVHCLVARPLRSFVFLLLLLLLCSHWQKRP